MSAPIAVKIRCHGSTRIITFAADAADSFAALQSSACATHNLSPSSCLLTYVDSEKDTITVGSAAELSYALTHQLSLGHATAAFDLTSREPAEPPAGSPSSKL